MALRNQPYIPLYVQDFLTDEKLIECSAKANGVYIRLMCIMHKSEEYGTFLLKQKDKQSDKQVKNFALKLGRYMPYPVNEIEEGLIELLELKVIYLDDDKLCQKRMIKDNSISNVRAEAGRKGGNKTTKKKGKFAQAKNQANTEDEDEYENTNESIFDYYSNNINMSIGSIEYEKINYWLDIFSIDIIKYSIDIAVMYKARNMKYIEAILNNWQKSGIKSLQEIKDKEIKRNEPRSNTNVEIFDYDWLNDTGEDE